MTALEGILEEVISLVEVIPSSQKPQEWLRQIEDNMRNTMVKYLFECLDAGLHDMDQSPLTLMEQLISTGRIFGSRWNYLSIKRIILSQWKNSTLQLEFKETTQQLI